MVREPEQLVRLTRLSRELAVDVGAMRARAAEIQELTSQAQDMSALDRPRLVLVAVNLHGWYTALETAMERVARLFDQAVPASANWHAELVAQMATEVPALRPAVLPAAALPVLAELRRFRHFFRNAYVLDLDPSRIRARVEDLRAVERSVTTSIDGFWDHLCKTLAALSAE